MFAEYLYTTGETLVEKNRQHLLSWSWVEWDRQQKTRKWVLLRVIVKRKNRGDLRVTGSLDWVVRKGQCEALYRFRTKWWSTLHIYWLHRFENQSICPSLVFCHLLSFVEDYYITTLCLISITKTTKWSPKLMGSIYLLRSKDFCSFSKKLNFIIGQWLTEQFPSLT